MTMNFIKAEDVLVQLLGDNAAGEFSVIGYKRQQQDVQQVRDKNRSVQVYTEKGKLDRESSPLNGPHKYGMTVAIEITASKASKANLSVIKSTEASPEQIVAAMDGIQHAAKLARDSAEECYDKVFAIIMDSRNKAFGDDDDTLVDLRTIDGFKISQPSPVGSLVVVSLVAKLTFDTDEEASGDTPVQAETPAIRIDTEPFNIEGEEKDETTVTVVECGSGE
jgi:hypothetical protein